MNLHPDLQALTDRYRQLHAAASEGHITPEDALSTLGGLSVTDGTGAVWKINQNGDFIRAAFSGAPATPAEPTEFIGPETVTSNPEIGAYNIDPNQAPTSPTWDDHPPTPGSTPTSPSGFGGFGTPPNSPAAGFPPSTAFGTPAPAGSPFEQAPTVASHQTDPFTVAGTTPIGRTFESPGGRSLYEHEARATRPARSTKLIGFARANKFLVVIAAIAVVFVGQRILFHHSTGAGSQLPHSPTATRTTGPDTGPSQTLPTDTTSPTTGSTTAPVTASLPDGGAISTVVSALTSGNRTLISAQIVGSQDASLLAHAAALFAGLKPAGLSLVTGATAPGAKAGTAVQNWTITSGNRTLLTVPATWVRTGGAWKLSAIPLPN